MKTSTLVKMNEIFHATGYRIARAECEKFEVNKEKKVPSFHAYVWLILEVKVDPKPDAGTVKD